MVDINAGTRPIVDLSVVRVRQLGVVVSAGVAKGRTVSLEDGPVVVGSDPECELVLLDDTVSRRHCELVRQGDRVLVRDLGSTNGVIVSGVRVREAELEVNARLKVGESELVLKAAGEEDVQIANADRWGPLIGTSAAMRRVFSALEAVARSSAPVLIEGETGTGKDLTAEALHRASARADETLVVLDCGAIAGPLLEAELFGYEKGAFTGAVQSRTGLAETAHRGSLVIDEIGELPLDLQPKLLRLIDRKEVRPLGATGFSTVDVRIIACTHRSLRAEVKAGRFREDLYFRLCALRIRLPALRERIEDLPALVDHLLRSQGAPNRFADLAESDRAMLTSHRWPGNIRELRNAIDRLLVFPAGHASGLVDGELSASIEASAGEDERWLPLGEARSAASERFERSYLAELLRRSAGSISEGARLADVSRQFLQRILRKHGMR